MKAVSSLLILAGAAIAVPHVQRGEDSWTVLPGSVSLTHPPAPTGTLTHGDGKGPKPSHPSGPKSSALAASGPADGWTTSTVYTTTTKTITSCASTVTSCPAHSTVVTTITVAVSTTVCPVASASAPAAPSSAAPASGPPSGVAAPTSGASKPAGVPTYTAAPTKSIGTISPPKSTTTAKVVVTAGAAPNYQRAGSALAAVALVAALI